MTTQYSLQPPNAPKPSAESGGGHGLWDDFLHHGLRWLRCDFTRVWATPPERAELATATPPIAEPMLQDYVAWRRSMVWIAVILAAIGTLDELIRVLAFETGGNSGYSGFARFLKFLTFASHGVLLAALLLSARTWTRPGADRRRLRWAWAIALFVPVVLMLLPLSDLLFAETPEYRDLMRDPTTAAGVRGVTGLFLAVMAFWTAMPGLMSVFPGAIRAGAIMKTLLPGRSLGPVVLLILAPIYALFVLVVCTVLQQVGNNMLFLVGALLLLASPLVAMRAAWALVPPCSKQEAGERVARYRLLSRTPTFAGLFFLLIGLFTTKLFTYRFVGFGHAMFQVHQLLLMVIWFFAMLTTYTVVSADFLLQAMRIADTMRSRSEASLDFQRDTKALVQLDVTLVTPPVPAAPHQPTSTS